MKVPEFKGDELQPCVEFMLNQFRRANGFWFLRVESTCGYDAAIRMNEEVWDRMGKLMAREIMERFFAFRSLTMRAVSPIIEVLKGLRLQRDSRHNHERCLRSCGSILPIPA